ncbi:lycopene cyclase [Gemmatimonadetes bacterium T265]|nr:lycopene cyclase [Gemmatimonadetes bacterium T265]
MVVVDARTTFGRDRTWCFWDVHPHAAATAVTHRWARWRVTGRDGTDVVRTSGCYTYQHIPADAFYADALARIAAAPHVELRLGEPVQAIADAGACVRVHTTRGVLRAAHVFDSRPLLASDGADQPRSRRAAARLVQAFSGAVIRTPAPAFDASTATLMDFTVDQPVDGFAFGYVLPYSPRDALVELAVIAEHPPAPAVLDAALVRYTARLTDGAHTVRSREAGLIPMDAAAVLRRPSARVTRLGVAGGLAKPSTGYAFLAIQRDAAAIARSLAGATGAVAPLPPPRSPVARWLDHVFLRRLRADPAAAPALFARLFAAADADALVRFLSDVGSYRDAARVVAALPPWPFVTEAWRLGAARVDTT